MATNDVNNSFNVGANNELQDMFQLDDSISKTHNGEDEITPICEV